MGLYLIAQAESAVESKKRKEKKKKSHYGLICPLLLHGSYVGRMELSLTPEEGKVKIWEAGL